MRTASGWRREHLLDEVVDDVPVVPGEAGDEAGGVVASLQREGGQLQGGDPALGALLEGGDRRRSSRSRPATSLRYAVTSSRVKRRSAARTSTSSPRARSRASGRAGSARVLITRCTCGGQVLDQERDVARDRRAVGEVVVVEDQVDARPAVRSSSLSTVARTVSIGGCGALQERQRAGADAGRRGVQRGHHVGPERRRAAARSPPGTPTRRGVRGRGRPSAQAASRVVLPKPGGAETSVSRGCAVRVRAARRAGGAAPVRVVPGGMKSLVRTKGLGMAAPLLASAGDRPDPRARRPSEERLEQSAVGRMSERDGVVLREVEHPDVLPPARGRGDQVGQARSALEPRRAQVPADHRPGGPGPRGGG